MNIDFFMMSIMCFLFAWTFKEILKTQTNGINITKINYYDIMIFYEAYLMNIFHVPEALYLYWITQGLSFNSFIYTSISYYLSIFIVIWLNIRFTPQFSNIVRVDIS